MTKADQARITAWRLGILQHAEGEPRQVARTCRYFGISRTAFYLGNDALMSSGKPAWLIRRGIDAASLGARAGSSTGGVLAERVRPSPALADVD